MNKSMRVLLVDSGLGFGGSLVVVARIAKCLGECGVEPILVSSMDLETIRHHAGDNVKIYRAKKPFDYVHKKNFADAASKISNKAIRKLILKITNTVGAFLNLQYLLYLAYIILKERIDLVHLNHPVEAALASLLTRRKYIWHMHGASITDQFEIKYFSQKSDCVVTISEYVRSGAIRIGVEEGRIEFIPNPLPPDIKLYSPAQILELQQKYSLQDKVVISIFGRLIEWKGQLQFLMAIKGLKDLGLNFHALIVGDDCEGYGSYREQLENYVSNNQLQNYVSFTGYQQDVDIYYQVSDIVAHCSIKPEPFGLVITEAMINKCAVIGSNLGAAPEIIKHEYTGLVVDPNKTQLLVEAMKELVLDEKKRVRFAELARQECEEKYSPLTIANRFAELYAKVLNWK